MSLWSPVDLLSSGSGSNRTRADPKPVTSTPGSVHRHTSSPADTPDETDRFSRTHESHQRNGVTCDQPNGSSSAPPAAHSGASVSSLSKQKRHLMLDSSLSSKRPRVRDYTGSRSGVNTNTRHLFVDLPPRPAAQLPFPTDTPFPLVKTSRDSLNCDKVAKDHQSDTHPNVSRLHQQLSEPSETECGAPLDLCIKKSSARRDADSRLTPTTDPSLARRSTGDHNYRLSDISQCNERPTSVSSVFPKKRGRKPKSLLMANSGLDTVPTSLATQLSAVEKPRKRGRPPLMSPPPNIGVDASSNSAASNSRLMNEDLTMISNRLQASVFAQQQLAAQGWQSLFSSNAGQNPFLLPASVRDAFAQLSSLNSFSSLPSASSSHSSSRHAAKGASETRSHAQNSKPQNPDSDADSEDDSKDDFRPDLNEEDIRAPLRHGWRRYTIINKITASGVRGDVLYMSPEGKKLRNQNDIQRYLNKNPSKHLTRDNFSFSCKWFVGEFNQPSLDMREHQMLSESEVINRIEELKRLKRKKMGLKVNSKRLRKSIESVESVPSGNSIEHKRKLDEEILRVQAAQMLQLSANLRLDERKIRDVIQAIQKSNQNQEHEKLKDEEISKLQAKAKAREIEIKRQQEEQLQKEQELQQKRRELQMMAEIERERRRQHMLMVRSMDLHKRVEERERKREEMIQEKKAAQEKKQQKKRLEMELIRELRKPVDDMRLKDMKTLPTLNRIPGLKLPAKAFSEVLMVFEFLYNFGETLGFDMESLPSLNSFQLALLNMDETSEDELLSVLRHLLVCVIEDPGLPVNMTTVVGQKLKDAPVTNFSMSEVLRIYFQSVVSHRESANRGQEGKILHSLSRNKPFLSLPPTLKAEILAYLCNELLCNQSIVKQIDENIENVAAIRKDKWVVDCELRKFRGIRSAREKKAEAVSEKAEDNENSEVKNIDDDDQIEKRDAGDDESGDSGAENDENGMSVSNEQDEEPEMSNEEIDKRIEKLSRQCTMMTNKLTKAVHGLRVSCLGQDRYRRRYWALPAAGGVFVEGLESAEPEELENNVHDPLTDSGKSDNSDHNVRENETDECRKTRGNLEVDSHVEIKPKAEELDHINNDDETPADKIYENKISVSTKSEENDHCGNNQEGTNSECRQLLPEKRPNSSENMTSQAVGPLKDEEQKGSGTKGWFSILPRDPCTSTILTDDPKLEVEKDMVHATCNNSTDVFSSECAVAATVSDEEAGLPKKKSSSDILTHLVNGGSLDPALLAAIEELGDICPSLQKKLTQQRDEQFDEPQKIPPEFQFGWWRLNDPSQIRALVDVLHERGVRERFLHKHFLKYMSYVTAKCKSNVAEFDVTELDRKIYEECSYGAPRDSGRYCKQVALRFDIAVIEEIETLEEKISNSSMQVRGWKPTLKIGADPDIRFERKLAIVLNDEEDEENQIFSGDEDSDDADEDDSRSTDIVDTLSFGKERLLATEAMIERRYLKPPLGFKANTVLLSSGSTDELAENAADENAPSGLIRWREAVRECSTSSQLALLLHFLESCIAWDKSIMRASCQFCCSGENEAQLLLCDGCDKGYHMYCFRPKMENVPEGDWFCFECQNKNTIDKVCIVCGKKGKLLNCETCPKVFHPNCIDPPVSKLPKGKWSCQICIRKPKKVSKTMARKSTGVSEEKSAVRESNKELTNTPINTPREGKKNAMSQSSGTRNKKDSKPILEKEVVEKETKVTSERHSTKKERKSKENTDVSGLAACGIILSEMESHEDAWPFKTPVNTKQFPTYKKIIKKPMDLQSMRHKLESGLYKNKMDWNSDVTLMFDNCEVFNEDESPVGRAGHSLRSFFDQRWKELCEN